MSINVNTIRRDVLFSLLTVSLSAVADPPIVGNNSNSVLGRWRSLSTSKGGISNMITFRDESVLDYSSGAIVDGSYRIEGDQLIILSAAKDEPEQRETVTWLSDKKVKFQSSIAEGSAEFSRVGTRVSVTEPLVGEWVGSRKMDGHSVQVTRIIRPNGRFLLLIPFLPQPGYYKTSGDQIIVTIKNKVIINGSYRGRLRIRKIKHANGWCVRLKSKKSSQGRQTKPETILI